MPLGKWVSCLCSYDTLPRHVPVVLTNIWRIRRSSCLSLFALHVPSPEPLELKQVWVGCFEQAFMCPYPLNLMKSCLGGRYKSKKDAQSDLSAFASREFGAQLSFCHCNLAGNQLSITIRFPSFNYWEFRFSKSLLQQQWWLWILHQRSALVRVL